MKKPVYRINLLRVVPLQKGLAEIARQLGRERTAFEILAHKIKCGEAYTAQEFLKLVNEIT